MKKEVKIFLKTSKDNQVFVSVKAANNKNIVTSETYKTKRGAEHAAELIKKIIKDAVIVDKTKKK